jgi:succinate dehydrogenase / fumarate reductase flavoprotein subunit
MGGLWVDYNLQSSIPGLFVLGEANFSDHGANRLGASALMQGLADGYFIIPHTIADYLARMTPGGVTEDHSEFKQSVEEATLKIKSLLSTDGKKTVSEFHRALGRILWDYAGMARSREGLEKALGLILQLREEFRSNLIVPGRARDLNQELEKAGRVADFLEFADLLVRDALHRNESCGGHFRVEYQTEDGEALRDDDNFCYVAAWEYKGPDQEPVLHKEPLNFENVRPDVRSYK